MTFIKLPNYNLALFSNCYYEALTIYLSFPAVAGL